MLETVGKSMLPCSITRVLSDDEYKSMVDDAVSRGWYSNDPRMFTPGMAWHQPWYYDPTGARQRSGKHVMCEKDSPFLSVHYWRFWSDKRAPICIVGPDGSWWEIDRKSKNGTGWLVTGELPKITCQPSIVLTNYHGYLTNGEFGPDIDAASHNAALS